MRRRTFLSTTAAAALGTGVGAQRITAQENSGTIDPILFDSTSSLLNASGDPLTDASIVPVRAESVAFNADDDGNGDATSYPDGTDIPLVAIDGGVVGIGAPLVPNDIDFGFGSEEFLLNVYDSLLGGDGTILWDGGHSQFYQLDSEDNGPGFGKFESYAEDNGYTLQATTDFQADIDSADAIVITSPSDAFTTDEKSALSTFVDDGGVVFLHDQSDFSNFDETDNLNAIASALSVGFRFNDDQVFDDQNNGGSNFQPITTNFNTSEFQSLFDNRPGVDEATALDPEKTYTVDVVTVADGDTVDVQFDDGRVETIRVLGIDTPETRAASDAERPQEWEGLSDRVGLLRVQFGSSASLLDDNNQPLTSDIAAVYAEPTAYNIDRDGNGDAVEYPADTDIPLLAIDGSVVGVGSILVDDDTLKFNDDLDNEELMVNVWDEQLGGSGRVRWDEGHGQFWELSKFSTFESYAEDNGYTVESGTTVPADTSTVDGFVVTSPGSFSSSELTSLSSFVDDGGAIFLQSQSDNNDFDETGNLNAIAAQLGVGFRFNDDQVQDDDNNTGQSFRPTTTRFDPTFDLFRERKGLDRELVVSSEGTPVEELAFDSTASLLDDSRQPLTDSSVVPVFAESTATNEDSDGNGDAVSYPASTDIPLVAVDGNVVGFGAPFVNDEVDLETDNEEFLLNLYDDLIGGSGTIRWDESHNQFYSLDRFETFQSYAEDNGYTVESGTEIPSDTTSADALVVTSPDAFSSSELSAVSSFVADGGVVFLHDQSDFSDFDLTSNLNQIASTLGVGFRFNDDQVIDDQNNANEPFVPTTTNFNESAFGSLFDMRSGVDDVTDFWGATYPYLSFQADRGSAFAEESLAGETVDIRFDPAGSEFNDGVRDPFGRVLAYIDYDATGDGNRDTLYNRRIIEEGHARAYASSFSMLEDFLDAELSARSDSKNLWRQSNPDRSPVIRDRPVSSVFVPQATRVSSASGSIDREDVVLSAEGSANLPGAPLGAVDSPNRLAVVGGLLIDESYERAEGFAVDTSGYENFTLAVNLLDYLSAGTGPVLVAGGGGQFNASYSLSNEDVAYFQRFLEGHDIALDGLNDLADDRLGSARALIVTPPVDPLSEAELDEIVGFADDGGAVLLVGGADAPSDARDNLNAIATALGSDLQVTGEGVTDSSANVNGDSALPVVSSFDSSLPVYDRFTGEVGIDIPGAQGPAQDLDNDGLFEDVDGDGTTDIDDALAFSREREASEVRENPDAFDFDGDGASGTVFDVVKLFEKLR